MLAVPVALPWQGSVNLRLNVRFVPDTEPSKVPRPVRLALNAQPDCAITITPLPERPHESLQKVFRDPATVAQVVWEGVGVGHRALGGQFGSLHPIERSAAASPPPRMSGRKQGLMAFPIVNGSKRSSPGQRLLRTVGQPR